MPRTKHATTHVKRRKKVLKLAKGFWGGRSKRYRIAKQSVMKALTYATRDRKAKKRSFRGLWIIRINAACRERGMKYSEFISALKSHNIILDRKILAHLAVEKPHVFDALLALVAKK